MANTGDIRQLTLDKLDQRVTVGADFSRTPKWAKEAIPTTGAPDIKWTKQNEDIEGVDIQADGEERELLIELANDPAPFDCSYVTANGDTYTASIQIAITSDTTQDAKVTITILPISDWTPIIV